MKKMMNALAIVTLVSRTRTPKPFAKAHENDSYAHLSRLCAEAGIELYVAHFDNAASGTRVLAWRHDDEGWHACDLDPAEVAVAYADLPPNEPGANRLRALLDVQGVTFVNNLPMNDDLTDKLRTYELFPQLVPPTSLVTPDVLSVLARLSADHPDLRTDRFVVKPRYGERGKLVETLDAAALEARLGTLSDDLIVQPLLESNTGIPELGIEGRHDLRMMVLNGKVTDFFIRVAPEEGFICNQSHGGRIAYFGIDELPARFLAVAQGVDEALAAYAPRYYSVDVGVGPSGQIWVYELNTMPGVVWNAEGSDKDRYVGMHANIVEAIRLGSRRSHR